MILLGLAGLALWGVSIHFIFFAALPSLIMEVSSFHPVGLLPTHQRAVSLAAMDDMDIDMDIDLGPMVVDEPGKAVGQL